MLCPSIARLHSCQQFHHNAPHEYRSCHPLTPCFRSSSTKLDKMFPALETSCHALLHRSSTPLPSSSSPKHRRTTSRIASGIRTSKGAQNKQTIKANVERAATILNEVRIRHAMHNMHVSSRNRNSPNRAYLFTKLKLQTTVFESII